MPAVELPYELYDTREERRSIRGSTGTRKWLCKWEDRYGSWLPALRRGKFTDGTEDAGSGTPADRLIVVGYDFNGVGAGRVIQPSGIKLPFDCCEVTVHYADTLGFDASPRERWSGAAHMINVAVGRTWPDGTPCDIPIMRVVPQACWEFVRFFEHNPNRRAGLLSKMGQVNQYTWRTMPPETVRFDYPEITTDYDDAVGTQVDCCTFKFTVNPNGWNVVWKDGVFVRPSGPPIYPLGDFEVMLGGGW